MLKNVVRFLESELKDRIPDFDSDYLEMVESAESAYEVQSENYKKLKESKASKSELERTKKILDQLALDLGGFYVTIFNIVFDSFEGREEECDTLELEEKRLQLLYDLYFRERKILTGLFSGHQELTGSLITSKEIGDALSKCTEEISGSGVNKKIKSIQKLNANLKEIIELDGEISEHQAKIDEIASKIEAEEALLVSSISSNFDRISLYLSRLELNEEEYKNNLERINLVRSTIDVNNATLKIIGSKANPQKKEILATLEESEEILNGYLLLDSVYQMRTLIDGVRDDLGLVSKLDANQKTVEELEDLLKFRIQCLEKEEDVQIELNDYKNFAASITADLDKYKLLNRHRKEKKAEEEVLEKKIKRRKNLTDMNSALEMVQITEEIDSRKKKEPEIKVEVEEVEEPEIDVDERLNQAFENASKKVEGFGSNNVEIEVEDKGNVEIPIVEESTVSIPAEEIQPTEEVVEPKVVIPEKIAEEIVEETPTIPVEMPVVEESTSVPVEEIQPTVEVAEPVLDTTDMITAVERTTIKVREQIEAKRPQIKGFFEKMMQRLTNTEIGG